MSTAVIIGAQGALGAVAVRTFRDAGWQVYPGGRRPDVQADFRHVDLDEPATIGSAFVGCDVAISTVPHAARSAERLVLERGGILINPTDMNVATAADLLRVAEPKGTVLVNAGLVPGLTNLVAAELVRLYPEADEIEIAFTTAAAATSGRAGGEFAHRVLTGRGRHVSRVVSFPMPLGNRPAMEFGESDRGYLGPVAGGRAVRTFISFDGQVGGLLRTINRLGLFSILPRVAFTIGRGKAVEQASDEPVGVRVEVSAGGKQLGAGTIFCRGDYRATAATLLTFAETLLFRPEIPRGMFYPEQLLSLRDVLPLLSNRGVHIGMAAAHPDWLHLS
ncbi:hypothetical protein BOX37_05925 [Nocardia mangyaensis]|uniref:Saccharopine dehydrogenase NADP binding domain-containing protein n=1 Tax=Nocardia mangyaensis TaxID=2213200 RepID=A0A1J0VNL7_9NOCA|nr:hypothetical protein [Nocardia mangyaensis]APE33583.1 hypothetical protein BOX37_05925 [Nocardia mangyaensis]